jgi:hypothetical protein
VSQPGATATRRSTCSSTTWNTRTEFGARSVVWSVNGVQVFADRRGVRHRWHAFLIVNLSGCAGHCHPAPAAATTEMSFEVSSLVVRRPAPHGHPPGGAASAGAQDGAPGTGAVT